MAGSNTLNNELFISWGIKYIVPKEMYDKLCKLPIHLIDNGEFEKELHKLFSETRAMAKAARSLEGMPGNPDVSAFDVWQKVYVIVNQLGKLHGAPHRKKRTGAGFSAGALLYQVAFNWR